MKTNIYAILCCCLVIFSSMNVVHAQFPYNNPGTSSDEFSRFVGSDKVDFKTEGIVLTSKEKQTSGVFLDELAFASNRGFILGFDYLMTGVGGGVFEKGANGLALVLFDASVRNPVIGSSTSGLGYSYSKAENATKSVAGLTKGFLSIGLDLYGDSKERKKQTNEFRNGIYTENKENNHLTVRGQGTELEGYPVYISQNVTDMNIRYKLNTQTGDYTEVFDAPDAKEFSFKLRENNANNNSDINASFGDPSYRRVIVSLLPVTDQSNKGYYLNVDMIHGSETSRIVNAYFISLSSSIRYKEAQTSVQDVLRIKNIVAPEMFKIGFTATTGTVYQKNIVRNISISIPFAPLVKDVIVPDACKDHTITIDVLANSIGFNTNKYQQGQDLQALGSKEHLDPYSFRFLKTIDGSIGYSTEPYVVTTAVGRYEYSPVTMQVIFTPQQGVTVKEDAVYFSIKNKRNVVGTTDLGGEQYRSEGAKIELNFTHNCNDIIMVNGSVL